MGYRDSYKRDRSGESRNTGRQNTGKQNQRNTERPDIHPHILRIGFSKLIGTDGL